MSMDRRAFLGTLAAGLGAARLAPARDILTSFNRDRIDRAEAQYTRPVTGTGLLDQPAAEIDDTLRGPQTPYQPQPGDIVFSTTCALVYKLGHRFAGAGEPSHSAIVVQRRDGSLAVMEAGPFDVPLIRSLDLTTHLGAYHERGKVWIRPRTTPLTPDQSGRLTEFAEMQENKPFARFRLCAQVTPFRSRGRLRTYFVGRPHGPDRLSYFCAELVTEAIVYSGLIAGEDTRPSATYPSDLFFDQSKIPFINKHFKLAPCWAPPSRWRPCAI